MKPILFNTEMVQAIMEGRKTVTRRVIKPQPQSRLAFRCMGHKCGQWGYPSRDAHERWDDPSYKIPKELPYEEYQQVWTPPCNTGDILYVRETWRVRNVFGDIARGDRTAEIEFKAGGENSKMKITEDILSGPWWKPSIHMPKEAARIFLRVKRVSVERLQDISEDGATKEGCAAGVNEIAGGPWGVEDDPEKWTAREAFAELWDITIKPSQLNEYGWNANPWVWVIEFELCEKPEE